MSLKERLQSDMKTALRERDAERLGVIRMALAALKQREIDTGQRDGLSEADTLNIIERLIKQRREAAHQYRTGRREEQANREEWEAKLLSGYLPEPIDAAEVDRVIDEVIHESSAQGIRDMGKVMGILKARLAGKADMGQVSRQVKTKLNT